MAPKIQTTANSVESFLALAKEHKEKRIIALFCGSSDSESGESWCPDCVKAEPIVEKALTKAADDIVFVFCIVGDRQSWKDPNCEFRTHKDFRLTAVPTLLEWNTPKRLVEGECQKEDLVSLFFEED
ncbi:thioredoxin domain-containing protein 17-like [Apostichopus japonicus]|uniref:thioredoxin domain-containing protein 17-like n=1 Tax=Stichopus japonicus TaxID=307972 RepID=UPI003AB8CCF6